MPILATPGSGPIKMQATEAPTLGTLLDRCRELYLAKLRTEIETAHRTEAKVVSEAALLDQDGRAVREGTLGLPVRIDLILFGDGKPSVERMVDSDRTLDFSPIVFSWKSIREVVVGPFQWDWCQFLVPGGSETTDWSPLTRWYDEWFKEDLPAGERDLLNVVHFLSDPEYDSDGATFFLDLGSAPTPAFRALLDALSECGVAKVIIGQLEPEE